LRASKLLQVIETHSGCSGLPEISGRVIRVLYNSCFENRYPKMYIKFLLPDISGTRYFRLPKIPKITPVLQ
jgi:hypothetical protein